MREGDENEYGEPNENVQAFWKKMMQRFPNEKEYNREIVRQFKKEEQPEIIIVVDKLLTGFDEPKNIVLYITRSLKEHGLLQAIARVNRVCEGKDFSYIIDYYGILGNFDNALTMYGSLSDFDEKDLHGTLVSVREEIAKLPQYHSQLWDLFKTIQNKNDEEAFEQFLRDKAKRDEFYEYLSKYTRTLKLAISTLEFVKITDETKIEKYRKDLTFFMNLRVSVKARYSDEIDYKQYEKQIQKLIDTHVTSDEVINLTEQVNIFEKDKFAEEVEKIVGTVAKADRIASRTAKTISEKMDEDPAFYKKFSKMLKEAIEEWKLKRISDIEYLEKVTHIKNSVQNRTGDDSPEELTNNEHAKAFYGIALDTLGNNLPKEESKTISVDIGLKIDEIITKIKIVDWQYKDDIINKISQEIEDYLFSIKGRYNLEFGWDEIDSIIEKVINTAKVRYK